VGDTPYVFANPSTLQLRRARPDHMHARFIAQLFSCQQEKRFINALPAHPGGPPTLSQICFICSAPVYTRKNEKNLFDFPV